MERCLKKRKSPDDAMGAASTATATRGVAHQLSIFGYSGRVKRARPGDSITSATFRCAGHDWAIRYYPAGRDVQDKDQGLVSVVLMLLSRGGGGGGGEQVSGTYTLDVNGDGEEAPERHDIRVVPGGVTCWGHTMESKIVPVKDDRVTVTFALELCKDNGSSSGTTDATAAEPTGGGGVAVPPPNMSEHLVQFLESKQGADVTFHVEDREFPAHKLLLAMRSPVFRAGFFGSMKEAATRAVRILDMKADAFDAVLRFLYTDATPPDVDCLLDGSAAAAEDKAKLAANVRDLLAAADRFGLERMRLMCEKALCDAMDAENAVAALRLADQHHCQKLKAFCIDYMASSPAVLKDVMATDAFLELKESCPSLIADLLQQLATKGVL
ncbi:hypothetical protein ACP70R_050107 [Stipagrostis hirtigluma subsp. patula]